MRLFTIKVRKGGSLALTKGARAPWLGWRQVRVSRAWLDQHRDPQGVQRQLAVIPQPRAQSGRPTWGGGRAYTGRRAASSN